MENKVVKENIKSQQLADAISERYLEYAMSTIVARSLPDVRDGLKPVHRRILYGMRQLKLSPTSGYRKCAKVVGDVMGNYHPHGDASIYDAMVRLAQSFSVRYPLVIGQGNFGNIDGDSAAAMRYTEAKLSLAGTLIMDGLDENSVDFVNTYSAEETEPVVMPSLFPNLLLNGANGIAVGMATNIPPHNVLEVIDGIIALVKNPDITVKELNEYIIAPDFPTGGIIKQTKESITEIYETGRGGFNIRAKWEVENLPYSNYQIIISEIPYGVQKSKLIEKIAELITAGKLSSIGDIRDESDEKIRIVIEPKTRSVDPKIIMAQLFDKTELQLKFSLNMNVLDKNCVPQVMNLKQVLQAYVEHQINVIERKANFRLTNIKKRLNILNGFLITFLNLDRVIYIIREFDDAKEKLMEEFNLNEEQVEAILNMKLRSLKKLEEIAIKKEAEDLSLEQKKLESLLDCQESKNKELVKNLKEMRTVFEKDKLLSKRMTIVDYKVDDISEILKDDFMPKEPITIILSKKGWIKSVKNHLDTENIGSFKEGDELHTAITAYTTDKILFVMDSGQFFTIDASKIPSGRGYGDPINLLIDVGVADNIINMIVYNENQNFLLATKKGLGFRIESKNCIAATKNGRQIVNLEEGDKLFKIIIVNEKDDKVAVVGNNGYFLVFAVSEIPFFAKGKGVILQKYKDEKTILSDIKVFNSGEGLSFKNGGKIFNLKDTKLWENKRGGMGHLPPNGFAKSNKFNK